jgi:hypothetical protein
MNKHLISEAGSERATSGAGNKIITHDGKTHIVWQDSTEEGYFNQIRSFDHESGNWSDTFTLNQGKDNHARPVITMDQAGHLHAIMSGHNSPVTHRQSVRPNDATGWTDEQPAGSGTYPVVACGPDGTLYLTLRSPERWNGVDLYTKKSSVPWEFASKLIERDKKYPAYAGYQNGFGWGPDGAMHIVLDFYESIHTHEERGIHQAVCCMQSPDGTAWQKADGTPIALPARPEQLDVLVRSTGERHEKISPPVHLAQGCIAVDSIGTPHVLYVNHQNQPGELIHAFIEGGTWQQVPVDALENAFPEMRVTSCRGALTIGGDDTLFALLELLPLGKGWLDGKPTREMNFGEESVRRLVWLISHDRGESFEAESVIEPGTMFNEANVERPTGMNIIPGGTTPSFIYFDGKRRYREEGELIQNNVWFVRSDARLSGHQG